MNHKLTEDLEKSGHSDSNITEKEVLSIYSNKDVADVILSLCKDLELYLDLSEYGFANYVVPHHLVNKQQDLEELEYLRNLRIIRALIKLKVDIESNPMKTLRFKGRGRYAVLEKVDDIFNLTLFDLSNNEEIASIPIKENRVDVSEEELYIIKRLGTWQ